MQETPIWQRLVGALVYLLPWSDALEFGRSLFGLFPPLQWLAIPALPLLQLQQAIPFGGLILFLLLFMTVVRNPGVPYLVRFHALQAILIDILLVLLGLAFSILLAPLGPNFAARTLENTVFLGALLLILYSLIQSLRGREADIPTISEAVRMQLL